MLELCQELGGRLLIVEASTSSHADTNADTIIRDFAHAGDTGDSEGCEHCVQGRFMESDSQQFLPGRRLRAAGQLSKPRSRDRCVRRRCGTDTARRSRCDRPGTDLRGPVVRLTRFRRFPRLRRTRRAKTRFRVFPGEGAHSDDLAAFVGRLDALGYAGSLQFRRLQRRLSADAAGCRRQPARRAAEWLEETVLRRALPVPNI